MNCSDDPYADGLEKLEQKYGELDGTLCLVQLQKGITGLGLSLAGNKDRNKMSVFVCGIHPRGSAYRDGRIQVGDEILEVNGYVLYGRCHLNASAAIKGLDGPIYQIILLRREYALNEMAVQPLTQFPVHLEQEALEEKYNRFTGVRTVTVRKCTQGLGIMIIEGKHTDLGRGVFISDIQGASPAEQSGLRVGDMILCVNHIDLINADYDTAASLLKNTEGLLSITVAKPSKPSMSTTPTSTLNRVSTSRVSNIGEPGCSKVIGVEGAAAGGVEGGGEGVVEGGVGGEGGGVKVGEGGVITTLTPGCVPVILPAAPTPPPPLDMIDVEMDKKPGKGLGLSLGCRPSMEGIFVASVTQGGLAESMGLILEGDQIVELNGKDLRDTSWEEGSLAMKTSSGRVKLKLARCRTSLSPVPIRSSCAISPAKAASSFRSISKSRRIHH